jgi:hypothetical protein
VLVKPRSPLHPYLPGSHFEVWHVQGVGWQTQPNIVQLSSFYNGLPIYVVGYQVGCSSLIAEIAEQKLCKISHCKIVLTSPRHLQLVWLHMLLLMVPFDGP